MNNEKVKLLSPVTSYEAAEKVISAGANEIYCGVKIPDLRYPGLSMRTRSCSFPNYDELKNVVNYAHNHGVKAILTLELPFISELVEKNIKNHIRLCVDAGVDALIAGDVGIILTLEKMNLQTPIYASSYLATMNYEAVDFLKKIGTERVILERHVAINEIKEIVRRCKDVEIEVFIHGPGCSNINVNCYGCPIPTSLVKEVHSGWREFYRPFTEKISQYGLRVITGPLCKLIYEVYDVKDKEKKISNTPILDAYTYCALCKLPRLINTGVRGLKIVGRCLDSKFQEATTKIYRELIDLIELGKMEEYQKKLSSIVNDEKGLWFSGCPEACEQKRCYYTPFLHAPYKIPKTPKQKLYY